MIELPKIILPAATLSALDDYQQQIDVMPHYIDRVKAAEVHFKRYNRKMNPVFDDVKNHLDEICSGVNTTPRRSRDWARADYTIRTLQLNDRTYLTRARRSAYNTYKHFLGDYLRRRDEGEASPGLQLIRYELHEMAHITVWKEMQRQQALIPELNRLFSRVPEALRWE